MFQVSSIDVFVLDFNFPPIILDWLDQSFAEGGFAEITEAANDGEQPGQVKVIIWLDLWNCG